MSQEEYSSGVQTPVSNHSGLDKEEQHKLDGLDEDEIIDQLPSLPEKSAKDYL